MSILKRPSPETAAKVAKFIDPAFENRQVSILDAPHNTAPYRQAMRDYVLIRATEALLVEQRETNRLLAALVAQQG